MLSSIEEFYIVHPHTSIVLKKVLASKAACCKPRTDAVCPIWTRTFDMTIALFSPMPQLTPFVSLMLNFDLLVSNSGFTPLLGDIGMIVRKKMTAPHHCERLKGSEPVPCLLI